MRKNTSIKHYYYTDLNGFFPISVHVHEFSSFSAHRHDFCEFEYILEGQSQTNINGLYYPLKKSDAVFITPADIHGCQMPAEEKMKTITVHFSPDAVPSFSNLTSGVIKCSKELQIAFLQLLEESRINDDLSDLAVKNMLERIIILANRDNKKIAPALHPAGISSALAYIHKNFKEKITIDDVCQACGYSAPSLCKNFKEQTGMTVLSYINKQRLDCAQRMLLTFEDSVSDICYTCGFSSVRQFNRAFKKVFGCSPSEYKRSQK